MRRGAFRRTAAGMTSNPETGHSHAPRGSLKRRLVSGGAWTLANRLVVLLTQLASLAIMARLLPPAEMGIFFIASNLAAVVTVVSQLGLTQSVVRLIAEALALNQPGRARQAIVKVLTMGGASAVVVGLLMAVGLGQWLAKAVFDSPAMAALSFWIALWIVFQTLQRFLDETFRGLHDLRLAAIFGGIVTGMLMVVFLGILWLVKGHADLEIVLALQALTFGIGVLLAGLVLMKKLRTLRGEGTVSYSEIHHLSWPLFMASLTNIILLRADLWILGMFVPDHDVAIYGGAARIINVVTIPLVMASAILAPMIAELNAQGQKERMERVLRAVATVGGLPAIAVILFFVLFGGPLLELLYGDPRYRAGWPVLVFLGLGQLVNVWSGVCIQVLMMTGHQKAVMNLTLVTSLLTILGAVAAVQFFGYVGVAAAFGLGIAVQNFAMVAHSRRALGVKSYMLANPLALRGYLAEFREAARQRREARLAAREEN